MVDVPAGLRTGAIDNGGWSIQNVDRLHAGEAGRESVLIGQLTLPVDIDLSEISANSWRSGDTPAAGIGGTRGELAEIGNRHHISLNESLMGDASNRPRDIGYVHIVSVHGRDWAVDGVNAVFVCARNHDGLKRIAAGLSKPRLSLAARRRRRGRR